MDSQLILRGAVDALLDCTDPEVLVEGRAGTGKTTGILMKVAHIAASYPGSRILLCRETRASMTESVLVTWEKSILGLDHPLVLNGPRRDYRDSYDFPGGGTVVIGGLDKPAKLFSTEWDMVYVAEAIETSENSWELFGRAMRNHKVPYQQRIADVNPGPPDHWLNARADACGNEFRTVRTLADYVRTQGYNRKPRDGKMKRMVSLHQDNPAYWDMEAWDWTENGKLFISELKSMSGHRRKRMLDGLWVAESGVVFPEYDEDVHVIDDFEPPRTWPQILCYDPGYGTTSVLWLAISPDGGIFAYDQIYEGGRSVQYHCQEILRRPRNIARYFGDPNEMFSNRAQGVSCARQALECGLRFVEWPADSGAAFDAGVDMIRAYLENTTNGKKSPYLQICRRCTGLRSNFQNWSFKRNSAGELVAGADKYEKGNDHAMDCLRGGLSSRFLQKSLAANADGRRVA